MSVGASLQGLGSRRIDSDAVRQAVWNAHLRCVAVKER